MTDMDAAHGPASAAVIRLCDTHRTTSPRELAERCRACAARSLAFCGSLDPDEVNEVERIVIPQAVDARHGIVYEGDPADHVFNVTCGVVRLSKMMPDGRRQITGFLYPGDFLGASAGKAFQVGAEAITDVTLCRFPRRRFEELARLMPKLEHALRDITSQELARAEDQLLLLGRKTAAERLATFLLQIVRQHERHGSPVDPLLLPMSRTDIADYLGLTIETVSRTFSKLTRMELVELPSPNLVRIKDLGKIAAMAAGE